MILLIIACFLSKARVSQLRGPLSPASHPPIPYTADLVDLSYFLEQLQGRDRAMHKKEKHIKKVFHGRVMAGGGGLAFMGGRGRVTVSARAG